MSAAVEGGAQLGAGAGVDDGVGDQLGEAELGGGADVLGDAGLGEEVAQEPAGGARCGGVVVERDPGGQRGLVGLHRLVLGVAAAADADPPHRFRRTARGRVEQPSLRLVEVPLVLEVDHQPADRRADAGQRDDRHRLDLGRLLGHELVVLRVQAVAGAEHRLAGADHLGDRHVVVGVDVAPLGPAVLERAVARGEPQPPAAALGEREPDPAHARQGAQVAEQAGGDLVDAGGADQGEAEPRQVAQGCVRFGGGGRRVTRRAQAQGRAARPPARGWSAQVTMTRWQGRRAPARGAGPGAAPRPKRRFRPELLALGAGAALAVVVWGLLVWLAIGFGRDARGGDSGQWLWLVAGERGRGRLPVRGAVADHAAAAGDRAAGAAHRASRGPAAGRGGTDPRFRDGRCATSSTSGRLLGDLPRPAGCTSSTSGRWK